jgi:hypothetical protein
MQNGVTVCCPLIVVQVAPPNLSPPPPPPLSPNATDLVKTCAAGDQYPHLICCNDCSIMTVVAILARHPPSY